MWRELWMYLYEPVNNNLQVNQLSSFLVSLDCIVLCYLSALTQQAHLQELALTKVYWSNAFLSCTWTHHKGYSKIDSWLQTCMPAWEGMSCQCGMYLYSSISMMAKIREVNPSFIANGKSPFNYWASEEQQQQLYCMCTWTRYIIDELASHDWLHPLK